MNQIDDLSSKLEEKLEQAYIDYYARFKSNIEFSTIVNLGDVILLELYNKFLRYIKKEINNGKIEATTVDLKKVILNETSLGKELGEETIGYIMKYNDLLDKLQNAGKDFKIIVYEKCYVDMYQAFEQYLFDCFKNIYMLCPKFIFKSQTMNLYYEDIFENDNIEICREKIIDRKVKSIIQSNSIDTILSTFKDFGFKLKIPNQEEIYVISKNRNVLTHNNGIINNIYIDDLKKKEILIRYKINDSFSSNIYNEIDYERDIIKQITEYLNKNISAKHISNYYFNNLFM